MQKQTVQIALSVRFEHILLFRAHFQVDLSLLTSNKFITKLHTLARGRMIDSGDSTTFEVYETGVFELPDSEKESEYSIKFYQDTACLNLLKFLSSDDKYDHKLFEQETPRLIHYMVNIKHNYLLQLSKDEDFVRSLHYDKFKEFMKKANIVEMRKKDFILRRAPHQRLSLETKEAGEKEDRVMIYYSSRVIIRSWEFQLVEELSFLCPIEFSLPSFSELNIFTLICREFSKFWDKLHLPQELKTKKMFWEQLRFTEYEATFCADDKYIPIGTTYSSYMDPEKGDLLDYRFVSIFLDWRSPVAVKRNFIRSLPVTCKVREDLMIYEALLNRCDQAIQKKYSLKQCPSLNLLEFLTDRGRLPFKYMMASELQKTFNLCRDLRVGYNIYVSRLEAQEQLNQSFVTFSQAGPTCNNTEITHALSQRYKNCLTENQLYQDSLFENGGSQAQSNEDMLVGEEEEAIQKTEIRMKECHDETIREEIYKIMQRQFMQLIEFRLFGYCEWLFEEPCDDEVL